MENDHDENNKTNKIDKPIEETNKSTKKKENKIINKL